MRIIKLIPIIIKNLSLMSWQYKPTRLAIIILILAAIGFSGWRYYQHKTDPNDSDMTLKEAAKIGEVATHKLMVQIEPSKCPPELMNGCYERGDIVVILSGGRDFSDGEKAGFLILNMDLTPKQAELLMRPSEKESKEKPKDMPKDAPPMMEQVKIRRYAVDLARIGIGSDIKTGQVVDSIYKADIIREK